MPISSSHLFRPAAHPYAAYPPPSPRFLLHLLSLPPTSPPRRTPPRNPTHSSSLPHNRSFPHRSHPSFTTPSPPRRSPPCCNAAPLPAPPSSAAAPPSPWPPAALRTPSPDFCFTQTLESTRRTRGDGLRSCTRSTRTAMPIRELTKPPTAPPLFFPFPPFPGSFCLSSSPLSSASLFFSFCSR
jgi:hypothetical protein